MFLARPVPGARRRSTGSLRMSHDPMQPTMNEKRIVIVGRPNVGKSTLFNRLAHSRVSITDPTPGVTRDTVEALGSVGGLSARLVDTGGYTLGDEGFDPLVRERSIEAAREADVILFILDVTDLTAEDEEFAETLRPMSERTVLVVNKVDSEKRELLLGDFYALGFSELVSVSAAHGLGVDDLEEAIERVLRRTSQDGTFAPDNRGKEVGDDRGPEENGRGEEIRVAILGKPNTGKSTLANRLLGRERSITSEIAGTTRDVVGGELEWRGTRIEVLDTAGIRRKRSVEEAVEYYSVNRAVQAAEACDVAVLVVDARDGLTEQDKKIAQIVVRRGKAIVIALNKWDLMEDIPNLFQAVRDRMSFVFPVLSYAPVVAVSATEGEGVEELLRKTRLAFRESIRRIDTGELNRKLEAWVERTPPPVIGRGRLKLRYMTQVSTRPPTFVLFANRDRGVPESYLGYIRNSIRADLGFGHVPIRLELRSSRSK